MRMILLLARQMEQAAGLQKYNRNVQSCIIA